ncbi:MAG: hypothetical protein P1R58_07335 [bacterium]|nr:hypothetical protein [bacterium]
MSIGRSCGAVGMSRASWYKPPADRLEKDKEVIEVLTRLTEKNHRWGFWQSYQQVRLEEKLQMYHQSKYNVMKNLGYSNK